MSNVEQARVEALYREGVTAVQAITSSFGGPEWASAACGDWDGADTVRHLVAVADWYHQWLDRSIAGDASPPFSKDEFDARNREGVAARRTLGGPEAVARFAERAGSYLDRASQAWELPYGFPAGTITVGLHAGIAATEWHLHAWDLTTPRPARHEPADPGQLFTAAGTAMAQAQGGIAGRMVRMLVPLGARISPWRTLLKQSGRA